ncbi:MAG: CoA transferase [Chloroflexota bacterium]|nr:CoA transferase [Chloroflexota bacterium]
MPDGLLPGVRVLDVGQGISGPYCAKILAQMGAEVIKVEPPEGDSARRTGPFPGDSPHPEKSGLFLATNANKQGITLDLSSSDGAAAFRKLAAGADIVIENPPPDALEGHGLGYESLKNANPGLVFTSITPFGNRGPYKDFKATDLVLYHMSGHAHGMLGAVKDPDSDPPIRAGGHQAELVGGMAAATATLMALYRKRMTGQGSRIDISSFEAMVTQLISGLANSAYGRPAPPRDLAKVEEAAIGGMVGAIGGILLCNDGYVAISPREDAQWERWLQVMGGPPWATDERYATRDARQRNSPSLWKLLSDWSINHSKHEIARMGQEQRVPCFPVNTVQDLLTDEHLAHRGFFVEMEHPVAGVLRYPGAAYRFSNSQLPLTKRPAPLLGEHNREILDSLA